MSDLEKMHPVVREELLNLRNQFSDDSLETDQLSINNLKIIGFTVDLFVLNNGKLGITVRNDIHSRDIFVERETLTITHS
jgi:hypothetical protein